jgi:hypothetical protein
MAETQWLVSLSDGSTIVEQWIPGELSPWQQLLKTLEDTKKQITQLRLQAHGRTYVCVSNADGYYQARKATSTCGGPEVEERHGIGYVTGGQLHMTWVGMESGDVWNEVRSVPPLGVWRKV